MRSSTAAILLLTLSTLAAQTPTLPELQTAAATMAPDNLLRHIRELSSDAYGGRFPGSPGEEKSVAYILSQIKAIGLQPGAPNGGFVQAVPLIGTRSRGEIAIKDGDNKVSMAGVRDFVVWSNLPDSLVEIRNSGMVFAGYGVTAPEYKWDDYAGSNVKNKTVIVLTGEPPVAGLFLDNALTVYGRQGTKLDNAFRHGADAVLLVNPAQQPGAPLGQNNARENMTVRDGSERKRVQAQALITAEKAAEIFAAGGTNYDSAKAAAAKPGFKAIPLSTRITMKVTNEVRRFESKNIFAKIEGSDPALKNEYVIYSAHWDHHGQEGTQIFHGASDNAAGTAGVLELARAFRALNPAPRRTVIFFWPTAEEKGLLGAHYYVDHPLYPLAATVANINLDYFSNWGWGRTRDFSIVHRQFDARRPHHRSRSTPGPDTHW